ncbi:hypothetical protein F5884DRAFT_816473 [Neofusicoccum parvum]|nr:hypothetical protein F5884DRAFT_816473 [Neofusicoccum parvum]
MFTSSPLSKHAQTSTFPSSAFPSIHPTAYTTSPPTASIIPLTPSDNRTPIISSQHHEKGINASIRRGTADPSPLPTCHNLSSPTTTAPRRTSGQMGGQPPRRSSPTHGGPRGASAARCSAAPLAGAVAHR